MSLRERTKPIRVGWRVVDRDGRRIGRVDAVFVDYLLVRTPGPLPVDLYVPADGIQSAGEGRVTVDAGGEDAYARWHRPLRKAPHDPD